MATHEVYVKEYDCPTPVIVDGVKLYHQKGDGPRTCATCERYVLREECAGR